MKSNKSKIELSEDIYKKFASYYSRNSAWGIFHCALDDGNYWFTPIEDESWSDEEKYLFSIFRLLSQSQKNKLATRSGITSKDVI